MKTVLVLSVSDLGRDPRVHRQLVCLSKHYPVTAIGLGAPDVATVGFVQMVNVRTLFDKLREAAYLIFGLYQKYYWSQGYVISTLLAVKEMEFDAIIANDLNTLPLALKIANGTVKVIFDAHEYSPQEFDDRLIWRILFKGYTHVFCKKYLPQVDGMMTVCQGIADEYKCNYGVGAVVVTNAPAYQHLEPTPVDESVIRMIHHGGAMPGRHLELMIEMMNYLGERFTLDLMLMPSDARYFAELKFLVAGNPRIRFIDPVPMKEISKAINHYDLGVYLLSPSNFNNTHALPNKFFEFVQGRLAVVIGPSPEMAKLVRQYDCGVVADDFSPQAMARSISGLSDEQIAHFKLQAHKAAEYLCAENNEQNILDLIEGR